MDASAGDDHHHPHMRTSSLCVFEAHRRSSSDNSVYPDIFSTLGSSLFAYEEILILYLPRWPDETKELRSFLRISFSLVVGRRTLEPPKKV